MSREFTFASGFLTRTSVHFFSLIGFAESSSYDHQISCAQGLAGRYSRCEWPTGSTLTGRTREKDVYLGSGR